MSKYVTVHSQEDANTLYEEQGHKLHTFHTAIVEGGVIQEYWIMSQSSDKSYDDISNLKDVTPQEVDAYLADGWIIGDSWSKLVRMVKKNDGNRRL